MTEQMLITLSLEQTIERFDLKINRDTLAKRLRQGKRNRVNVPLTVGFHYSDNLGGLRVNASRFNEWLADDITQLREMAALQKEYRKVAS